MSDAVVHLQDASRRHDGSISGCQRLRWRDLVVFLNRDYSLRDISAQISTSSVGVTAVTDGDDIDHPFAVINRIDGAIFSYSNPPEVFGPR